jgi:hypothetical protein
MKPSGDEELFNKDILINTIKTHEKNAGFYFFGIDENKK